MAGRYQERAFIRELDVGTNSLEWSCRTPFESRSPAFLVLLADYLLGTDRTVTARGADTDPALWERQGRAARSR